MSLYSACLTQLEAADTLHQGHSMQRDFRMKHPRLYRPGRNPRICAVSVIECPCMWNSSTTFRARGRRAETADFTIRLRSRRAQLSSGSGASQGNSRCATGSDDGFGSSMRTSRAPWSLRSFIKAALIAMRVSQVCKLGSSTKILEMDESTQKTLLRCVFRVFTVSYDPASHPEDLFHMTFAKLSEGSSFPAFGGCDQLLFAQRSKIVSRCGITARRKQCTRHYGGPPLSNRDCQFVAPLIFFPFHPIADVRRTVLQLHPIRLAIS